jgi:hypothetical protein
LCGKIDNYIEERITAADQVIAQSAGLKIKDGDVLLTYARYVSCPVVSSDFPHVLMARSSVVEKVLLRAHEEGKSFSVYVVDSRPMLEGLVWYFLSKIVGLNLSQARNSDGAVVSWDPLYISPPSRRRFRYCRGFDRLHWCSLPPFKRSRALSSWDCPRFDDGETTLNTGRRLLRDVQNLGDGAAGQFHEK